MGTSLVLALLLAVIVGGALALRLLDGHRRVRVAPSPRRSRPPGRELPDHRAEARATAASGPPPPRHAKDQDDHDGSTNGTTRLRRTPERPGPRTSGTAHPPS